MKSIWALLSIPGVSSCTGTLPSQLACSDRGHQAWLGGQDLPAKLMLASTPPQNPAPGLGKGWLSRLQWAALVTSSLHLHSLLPPVSLKSWGGPKVTSMEAQETVAQPGSLRSSVTLEGRYRAPCPPHGGTSSSATPGPSCRATAPPPTALTPLGPTGLEPPHLNPPAHSQLL